MSFHLRKLDVVWEPLAQAVLDKLFVQTVPFGIMADTTTLYSFPSLKEGGRVCDNLDGEVIAHAGGMGNCQHKAHPFTCEAALLQVFRHKSAHRTVAPVLVGAALELDSSPR